MGRKGQLELTLRDIKIVQFVFEQRVASFSQLAEKFFPAVGIPTAFKRFEKLHLSGYLTKNYIVWENSRTAYFGSTEKGIKLIAEHYRYKITKPDFKSDSVVHDLGLVRLRKRIEQSKLLVEYLSESMLQSCSALSENENLSAFSRINSDAALCLNKQNVKHFVALEYEISDKSSARYAKKLSEYYMAHKIGVVLYVCGDKEIQSMIRQIDKQVDHKSIAKVFTCVENNLQNPTDRLVFLNHQNATLTLE